MKAVVLELRDGFAAVLREDGTVEKVRGNYQVGQTIELPEQRKRPVFSRGLRAAAAAVAILGILGGGYSYENVLAYSYVSLDIADTALEYTLNRRDQVVSVEARNEASEELAKQLMEEGVRRKDLAEALRQAAELVEEPEDALALVTVTSGSEDRAKKLEETAQSELDQRNGMDVEARTASPNERKAAWDSGMSTGRYQVSREQTEQGTVPDYKNGDIRDILHGKDRTKPQEDRDPRNPEQEHAPEQPQDQMEPQEQINPRELEEPRQAEEKPETDQQQRLPGTSEPVIEGVAPAQMPVAPGPDDQGPGGMDPGGSLDGDPGAPQGAGPGMPEVPAD